MSPPASRMLPTTVIAGRDGRLRGRLIAALQLGEPGLRTAWVQSAGQPDAGNAAGSGGAGDRGDAGDRGGADDRGGAGDHGEPGDGGEAGHGGEAGDGVRFAIAGGCVCCLAGPAFRATLARVLRAEPWDRLIVEVAGTGHVGRLVDQLRAPPFDRHLRIDALCWVLAADEAAARAGGEGADPAVASEVLVARPRTAAGAAVMRAGASAPDDPVARWLAAAPPWPRIEAAATDPRFGEWRRFTLLAAPEPPVAGHWFRCWPAERTIDRRRAGTLLERLAAEPEVIGFQALLRTARAWYCWRHGRGQGPGALGFDIAAGAGVMAHETGWRNDNRLIVWARPASENHRRSATASSGRSDADPAARFRAHLTALEAGFDEPDSATDRRAADPGDAGSGVGRPATGG
ncbi:MAG: GTP-binding protein [Lautropia sp.]